MITTDQLLVDLYNSGIEHVDKSVPLKDKKILSSLARQVLHGNFLTENQANLLVKIFKENQSYLQLNDDANNLLITTPTWSKEFRIIEQVKKIYFINSAEPKLVVEFTYNKKIKEILSNLSKKIQGAMQVQLKHYTVDLTEQNIHKVIKALKNHNFDIDPKLWNFYQEISKIIENSKNPFEVFSIENEKILKLLKGDVGDISTQNLMLLNDRRYAYQYTISEKNPENSLKNTIANRTSTRVYIPSQTYSLDEVVGALSELNRFPALVVFNGHDVKDCQENVKKMEKIVNSMNIDSVGIYFRFDNNSDANKNFNTLVSTIGFNKVLDKQTKIAGIVNNKLPKFLIKSDWYPKTVISFSNNFKNNKTSLYCDAVDLIIYYNSKQPLNGDVNAIV